MERERRGRERKERERMKRERMKRERKGRESERVRRVCERDNSMSIQLAYPL